MKNILKLGLVLSMFLICSCYVYGAIACTTGADDGTTIIGNSSYNATLTGTTAPSDYNATTPVLYGRCTDTGSGNTTYVLLVNATDATVWTNGTDGNDGATLNVTWDSTGFEDAKTCDFYHILSNITQGTNELTCTATSTSVIDNTVPTAPTSLAPATASRFTNNSFTLSGTVTDSETTGCTVYFTGPNPGNPSYSMTYSADSCTKSFTNVPNSVFYWYLTASDGTNTSTSSTLSLQIDENKGNYVSPEVQEAYKKQAKVTKEKTGVAKGLAVVTEEKVAGISVLVWVFILIVVFTFIYYKWIKD